MRIVHLITLISALFSTTDLMQLSPLASADQQSLTDYIFGFCNKNSVSSNDTVTHLNLDNAVYNSLTVSSSRLRYSLTSSESGTPSNFVHAMYQCRGDISLSDCSDCVAFALREVRSKSYCGGMSRGARLQLRGCFFRFETYDFSANISTDVEVAPSCTGSASESSQLYQRNLMIALKASATAAPQHYPPFGYNATTVGSGSDTAYVLTQCLGYLTASQCAACLSQVSNNNHTCNGSVTGAVYFVDHCYYLFGNTPLSFTYNNTISPVPGPPPASPPFTISFTYNNTISPVPGRPPPASLPFTSPPYTSPVMEPGPSNQPSATITSSNTPEGGRTTNHRAAMAGIVVGTVGLLACIIAALALCFFKRQKTSRVEWHKEQGEHLHGARRFSLKELQDATHNFHPIKKLGQGGFGPVYQGRLKSEREVAIKMLSGHSRQGKSEFLNEVKLISSVRHRNLIELIGYCDKDNKQLLVYEYLPNRSLDLSLFDVDENGALNWRTRFDIIVGIARGLRYLHEDSAIRIIHRDIKASNILLDNNLVPKIADFGLARLFEDDTSHLTTRIVGTLGYLAPEYALGGQLSEKADVYSFGLVVLEIVSGRRIVNTKCEIDKQNLLEWTWVLFEKHQHMQILDERVHKDGKGLDGDGNGHVDVGEVTRVVHVALLCTQFQRQARPRMSDVHDMLCGRVEVLSVPTRPMTVGIVSPIADLVHDGSPSSGMPFQPSWKSVYSHDATPMTQVEAR